MSTRAEACISSLSSESIHNQFLVCWQRSAAFLVAAEIVTAAVASG
jgi:hypothetical protein